MIAEPHKAQTTSRHLAGLGVAHDLEADLCRRYDARHAILVPNATLGLLALAKVFGLGQGEIIVPALTWGGTLAGMLWLEAKPVLVDVDPVTLCLDPVAVEAAITARTRGIVAVDLFGVPAADRLLRQIADAHGIVYLHDAAQSLGARVGGRSAGSAAHATVLSFGAGKVLDASEGGAILTKEQELHDHLVWHTQHPHRQKRELGPLVDNEFALNLRMHPRVASEILSLLPQAEQRIMERQQWASQVFASLECAELIHPGPLGRAGLAPSWHRLTVDPRDGATGGLLARELYRAGIGASVTAMGLRPIREHASFESANPETVPATPIAVAQARRRLMITKVGGHA